MIQSLCDFRTIETERSSKVYLEYAAIVYPSDWLKDFMKHAHPMNDVQFTWNVAKKCSNFLLFVCFLEPRPTSVHCDSPTAVTFLTAFSKINTIKNCRFSAQMVSFVVFIHGREFRMNRFAQSVWHLPFAELPRSCCQLCKREKAHIALAFRTVHNIWTHSHSETITWYQHCVYRTRPTNTQKHIHTRHTWMLNAYCKTAVDAVFVCSVYGIPSAYSRQADNKKCARTHASAWIRRNRTHTRIWRETVWRIALFTYIDVLWIVYMVRYTWQSTVHMLLAISRTLATRMYPVNSGNGIDWTKDRRLDGIYVYFYFKSVNTIECKRDRGSVRRAVYCFRGSVVVVAVCALHA